MFDEDRKQVLLESNLSWLRSKAELVQLESSLESQKQQLAGLGATGAVNAELATQQKEHHTYRHALRRILKSIEALQSQNAALAANAECVWRLAQSRGLLDSANGGLHSAWSGELQLPKAFGYTAETDTKRIKE